MAKLTHEQIDNYHSGRMSEPEMADFEKILESEPAIKAESDLQSDIVNGLKEYRKLELKTRLDAIKVGLTWIEFAQQSTLVKSLGGVVVASLIGTGIYYYGDRPESQDLIEPPTVDARGMESVEFVWDLGQEEQPQVSNELDKPNVILENSTVNPDAEKVEEATPVAVVETIEENKKEAEQVFKPSFEAPNAETVEDNDEFAGAGLDEIPDNMEGKASDDPIDVETENSKSNVIKYKYYDGKLFLNGDFDNSHYEILEINSSTGRRIYVYYLGDYYKVGIADKLTALPKVKDSNVINELKLLRENK